MKKKVLFVHDGLSSLNTIIFSCVQFPQNDMAFFCIDETIPLCVYLLLLPQLSCPRGRHKSRGSAGGSGKALWLPGKK